MQGPAGGAEDGEVEGYGEEGEEEVWEAVGWGGGHDGGGLVRDGWMDGMNE